MGDNFKWYIIQALLRISGIDLRYWMLECWPTTKNRHITCTGMYEPSAIFITHHSHGFKYKQKMSILLYI